MKYFEALNALGLTVFHYQVMIKSLKNDVLHSASNSIKVSQDKQSDNKGIIQYIILHMYIIHVFYYTKYNLQHNRLISTIYNLIKVEVEIY